MPPRLRGVAIDCSPDTRATLTFALVARVSGEQSITTARPMAGPASAGAHGDEPDR